MDTPGSWRARNPQRWQQLRDEGYVETISRAARRRAYLEHREPHAVVAAAEAWARHQLTLPIENRPAAMNWPAIIAKSRKDPTP